jgi:hypothetical protein
MICFDFEGKIKKYDSPEEILEDFYICNQDRDTFWQTER